MTRRSAAQAVKDHAAQHGVGSVPDGWVEWADLQLAAPKVPWEQKLARAIKHAVGSRPGAVDLTWRRRSRLQGGLGFGVGAPVLRGTHAPIPRVGIGVDTSGSIGAEEINRAGSEIEAILKTVQADVDFMAADAAVQSDVRVRSLAQVVANLKGGGGTDFRPMFKRFAEKNPPPEMVVFITDGCGPAPATPPPYAVIWVLVGAYRSRPQMYAGDKPVGECAWGEFIEVDDKPTPEGAEV
jgi:predicted metal-dependent peptidase